MSTSPARLVLGLGCLASTRFVYAGLYEVIGRQIAGPSQFLVPLLLTTAYLVASWLLIWGSGLTRDAAFWLRAAGSLGLAALIGISAGYLAMAVQTNPKTGMFTIFTVGGLAWCMISTLWWLRPSASCSSDILTRGG
jgi:hypothetical protein